MVCKQPAIDGRSVAAETKKKLPCVLQLEPFSLWVTEAALWQQPSIAIHLPTKCMRTLNFLEILNVHVWPLKFNFLLMVLQIIKNDAVTQV